MNQKDYEEQLAKAGEFHGEICGGIAIGTKLAMYGMELMGMELNTRHKNLIVFLEIDRCMADAVQSVTKCSMGKRSLKQMYYGKFAVTFYDMDTGEAIRVCDADANKKEKIKETRDEMIERFKTTPPEELFTYEKVKILDIPEPQLPGSAHSTEICHVCGEKVTDGRHLVRNGKAICKSCAEGSYYQIIE
ncbi:FmdE family protein [Methanobrevibacter sp.]|uniref:FmdE family protein n=1 Tax=Methanobrevibacter sp. TaxID=66852 RepID=UPI00388F7211